MARSIRAFVVAAISIVAVPIAHPILSHSGSAFAQGTADVSAKEAFEAARTLGTVQAWNAFLKSYPAGFYSDLARAYVQKLTDGGATPSAPPPPVTAAPIVPPAPVAPPRATAAPVAPPTTGSTVDITAIAPTDPNKPAVTRGGQYMGFAERFNRYYTDPSWKPARTLFVSPTGTGNGTTRATPMSPRAAFSASQPGTMIYFIRGAYQGCFEIDKERGGTYDAPVVIYGERNDDKSLGVAMTCCATGRKTCINLEAANYVAVDGFELIGGSYGVRAVGEGYPASQHSLGVAVIDNNGHDQERDPFLSGQASWAVWERNVASGAKAGDGHGIYLSNGGDWNIVRYNETFNNVSSDFQINADPASTCKEVGIPYNDPRCDAVAGTGEGGQGASDYFLVDSNYFHHGAANGSGANFTSVRRSVIRNNIFGFYPRHGVSFWQETDNPKLGSSDNKILHNLFISTGRHAMKFENNSIRNEFANNVLVGVRINGNVVSANPSALLLDVEATSGDNIYRSNLYISGKTEGRDPNAQETTRPDFSSAWFAKFPTSLNRDPGDFRPTPQAPFLAKGPVSNAASADRIGTARNGQAHLGPLQ